LLEQAWAQLVRAALNLEASLQADRDVSRSIRTVEAERKCLVCEWTGGVREPEDTPEIGTPCPTCRAPTERIAVRRSWAKAPHPHASALARLGASKGGRARADALSPKRRQAIARAAALARWKRG
jgi:hypothetical protein